MSEPPSLTRKREAYRYGLHAEWVCVLRLMLSGHRILARRFRNPFGEIDLIAARRNQIVFIEVKARKTTEDGLFSLRAAQQQRIARAASAWAARNPKYAGREMRFDLMVVSGFARVTHIQNAFAS